MMEVGFQTLDKNTPIISTAKSVLEDAVIKAFPVKSRIKVCVAANKYSYFTVTKHTPYPSKWMYVQNDKTGKVKMIDMTSSMIKLVTYAYRVEDIRATLDANGEVEYSMDLDDEYQRFE
jgi:hypothetical protein